MHDEAEIPATSSHPAADATLAKLSLAEIEHAVGVLPECLSHDQVLQWLMLATVLVERSKQVKQRVDDVAIAWIKGNGPLTNGPIVYSVGPQRQVKCRDVLRCMQLLLDACGGDIEWLCTCLAANPFKYGACGELLPKAAWNTVFVDERKDKLVLKSADTRYLPRRRHVGEP